MNLYIIINKINNKIYGGKTLRIGKEYDQYYGSGKIIKQAILKYGIDNFTKRTLKLKIKDADHLNKLERKLIKKLKYKFKEKCYNIHEGSTGGNLCAFMKDRSWVNKKISESKKEQYATGITDKQIIGRKKQIETLKQYIRNNKTLHLNRQKKRGKTLSNRVKTKGLTDKEKERNNFVKQQNTQIITYQIIQPNVNNIYDTSSIGEFVKKYKVETTLIAEAKRNNNKYIVKRRTSRTKHPFVEGTVIKLITN